MKFPNRDWILPAGLLVVAVLALPGCSKKSTGASTTPDVTTQPPATETGGTGTETPGGSQSETDVVGRDSELDDVYFQYDDHTLSAEARSTLSQNATYLREMGAMRVTIEGHCDERGTTEYNLALGQRRADAARSYLVDLGIDGTRLSTISYGEERPFATGTDESAWSQNRRAHFRVNN